MLFHRCFLCTTYADIYVLSRTRTAGISCLIFALKTVLAFQQNSSNTGMSRTGTNQKHVYCYTLVSMCYTSHHLLIIHSCNTILTSSLTSCHATLLSTLCCIYRPQRTSTAGACPSASRRGLNSWSSVSWPQTPHSRATWQALSPASYTSVPPPRAGTSQGCSTASSSARARLPARPRLARGMAGAAVGLGGGPMDLGSSVSETTHI